MYYEINVSYKGTKDSYHQHLFATAERSITTYAQAEALVQLFRKKFPESEGYKIIVTKWKTLGEEVKFNEC